LVKAVNIEGKLVVQKKEAEMEAAEKVPIDVPIKERIKSFLFV